MEYEVCWDGLLIICCCFLWRPNSGENCTCDYQNPLFGTIPLYHRIAPLKGDGKPFLSKSSLLIVQVCREQRCLYIDDTKPPFACKGNSTRHNGSRDSLLPLSSRSNWLLWTERVVSKLWQYQRARWLCPFPSRPQTIFQLLHSKQLELPQRYSQAST